MIFPRLTRPCSKVGSRKKSTQRSYRKGAEVQSVFTCRHQIRSAYMCKVVLKSMKKMKYIYFSVFYATVQFSFATKGRQNGKDQYLVQRYIDLLKESFHCHLELVEEQLHGAVRSMIHTFHRFRARKLLDPFPLLSVC